MKNIFTEKKFYLVTKASILSPGKNQLSVNVSLNPLYEAYNGHFEGLPVAPASCFMNMIQEILEGQLRQHLFLSEASDINFNRLVFSGEQSNFEINYALKFTGDKLIETNVTMKAGEETFIKMRASYMIQQ
ncbi:MAG: hypothetical protein ABIT08_12625 [Bacteroidia bacterium]